MLESAIELQEELIELRRLFHRSPELSFAEFQTAELAWKYLAEFGFSRNEEFKSPALVAELGDAPYLVLRTDMDALPVQEQLVSPYMSMNPGLMHACGHDAHMACVIMAARLLSKNRKDLSKGVRIVFEPGSESRERCGAEELISRGVLSGVEMILGFHVDSTMPASEISIVEELQIHSIEAGIVLSALPETRLDAHSAIFELSRLICLMKDSLPSGITLRFERLIQGEGQFVLDFVLQSESPDQLSEMLRKLEKDCASLRGLFSIEIKVGNKYETKVGASLLLQAAAAKLFDDRVKKTKRRSWSRDFEHYAGKVPAGFFYLGTGSGNRSHHSPSFDLDERCLYLAVDLLVQTALDCK